MFLESTKPRVGTTALTRTHFLLLYAAMLVAASGNTALQSVMPAIGREIGISDFWVAVAYTWSAVLWVALAPYWAEKSDHHGRKALTLLGLSGFIVSTFLCGMVLHFGLKGAIAGGADLHPVRDISSDLRLARQCHAIGNAGLSCGEDTAQRPGRGSFRTLLLVRIWARSSVLLSRLCSCCPSSGSRDPCSPSR